MSEGIQSRQNAAAAAAGGRMPSEYVREDGELAIVVGDLELRLHHKAGAYCELKWWYPDGRVSVPFYLTLEELIAVGRAAERMAAR